MNEPRFRQYGAMDIFHIPELELKAGAIARKIHADAALVDRLVTSIAPRMDIRAAFRVCCIDAKDADGVLVEGIRFKSRVLGRHLLDVGRVFPFVLTLGPAVDSAIDGAADILEKYLLDQIGNVALDRSRHLFEQHLKARFGLAHTVCMAPGSLEDWPIQGQAGLFRLLDDVEAAIGVQLTDSLAMVPRKSVSGLYFPSRTTLRHCRLCPRKECASRKAAFDAALARETGILAEKEGG